MKKLTLLLTLMLTCHVWAQDDIEVVNIEKPAVAAYMADTTYYHNTNVKYTVVTKYTTMKAQGERLDHPNGKKVVWTPTTTPDAIAEIRVTLSQNADYSDSVTYHPAVKSKDYIIRNMLPQCTYYYKVEEIRKDNTVTVMADGRFRTVGQVRMIYVPGVSNMRDIGGWRSELPGNPRIKYGRMYRSGHLERVTQEGKHLMATNLGVGAELDLRAESTLKESPLGPGVDYFNGVADSYAGSMNSERAKHARNFEWLVDRLREGKVVNWHCAVGCDRCGTLSLIIEGVLGVSEVDLTRDYEMSSFRGHKRYRGHVGFHKVLPWIKKTFPADTLHESFYKYCIWAGISDEDIQYLRSEMLEYGL